VKGSFAGPDLYVEAGVGVEECVLGGWAESGGGGGGGVGQRCEECGVVWVCDGQGARVVGVEGVVFGGEAAVEEAERLGGSQGIEEG
jgi:hypothetical protein